MLIFGGKYSLFIDNRYFFLSSLYFAQIASKLDRRGTILFCLFMITYNKNHIISKIRCTFILKKGFSRHLKAHLQKIFNICI